MNGKTENIVITGGMTARKLLFPFILFLTTIVHAQTTRYSLDFTLSKKNFVDTIAIDYVHGQVIVPLVANGREQHFMLDTGSGQAVVFSDTPIDNLTSAGNINSHDATGHSRNVPVVTLPPLQIGSLTLTGCHATLQQRVVKVSNMDGILGFDLVNKGLCMKIDVRHKRLILTDRKDFFDREMGTDARYKLNFHVPYVAVSPFGNYREYALFDTGSRRLYVMNKQSFDRASKKTTTVVESQVEGRSQGRYALGHHGTEPRGEVVFLNLNRLMVGDFTFSHLHTLTTQGGSHLGARVLEHAAVIFNPHKKRIRFQPYDNTLQATVDNRQTDIAFVPEQGKPAVGLVWEKGEPYRLGFREGDIIKQIDNKSVPSMTMFMAWGFEKGRPYRFTVQDKEGKTKEINWIRLK